MTNSHIQRAAATGFLARFTTDVQLREDFRLAFEAGNAVVENTKVWITRIEEDDTRNLASKEPNSVAEFSWKSWEEVESCKVSKKIRRVEPRELGAEHLDLRYL